MTVQDYTSIAQTPRYTCHQDIAGFRIELRDSGEIVDIEDVSGAEYTLFGVAGKRLELGMFEEGSKQDNAHSIYIYAIHEAHDIPLIGYHQDGLEDGAWPKIGIRYYRDDSEGMPITPLGLPKSFPDFHALLEGFDDIVGWMEGNPARQCTLSYTPTGGEETLLCHITRDNGELHSNCTTFSIAGLSL